jgi:hypothetical protein
MTSLRWMGQSNRNAIIDETDFHIVFYTPIRRMMLSCLNRQAQFPHFERRRTVSIFPSPAWQSSFGRNAAAYRGDPGAGESYYILIIIYPNFNLKSNVNSKAGYIAIFIKPFNVKDFQNAVFRYLKIPLRVDGVLNKAGK